MAFVVDGDEQASRPPVDEAELLTGQPNSGCIYDWHQWIYIFRQQTEEQAFISVLKQSITHLVSTCWNYLFITTGINKKPVEISWKENKSVVL